MVRELGYDLDGWKEIAVTLGVTTRTAQRWRVAGLPVSLLGRRVLASRTSLAAWLSSRVVSCRVVSLDTERAPVAQVESP